MKPLAWFVLSLSVGSVIINVLQQDWETAIWALSLAVWVASDLVKGDN